MDKVTDIIIMAVVILIVVFVITKAYSILSVGKDASNKAADDLTNSMAKFSTSQYDVYDGTIQSGRSVIDEINYTFSDNTIEILVCTKDGVNYVYNKANTPIFGALKSFSTTGGEDSGSGSLDSYDDATNTSACYLVTNPNNNQFLSGIPQSDAVGKAFSCIDAARQTSTATVQKATIYSATNITGVCTSSGYNASLGISSKGFISTSATFKGSVQRDVNGDVRRITFVQQ